MSLLKGFELSTDLRQNYIFTDRTSEANNPVNVRFILLMLNHISKQKELVLGLVRGNNKG